MKIIIAPNAFKGSLSASDAAESIATGIQKACPQAAIVEKAPVADGRDGLVDVFLSAPKGKAVSLLVAGPRWHKVNANFCYTPAKKMAAVKMACASGLALLSDEERDPTQTTTFGTGELIARALDLGAEQITIGIGGSATTDGGIGMAAALGARFLDKSGTELSPIGGNLGQIAHIDLSGMRKELAHVSIEAACDVDNTLLGEKGAARVYGPQKGATPKQVEELEEGMANLAELTTGQELGIQVADIPGAGAAGGLGAGLLAFLGAKLRKGIGCSSFTTTSWQRFPAAFFSLVFSCNRYLMTRRRGARFSGAEHLVRGTVPPA